MEEKTTIQTGLKGVWRHLKPFKKELILMSFLGLISSIANGFIPFVSGKFFDSLIHLSDGKTTGDFPLWLSLLLTWIVIQFIANNIDWLNDRLQRKSDALLQYKIQVDGFTHLLRLPVHFHRNEHIQNFIQRVSSAGWRIPSLLSTGAEIVPQTLSVVIGLVLCITINAYLALILVIGVCIYFVLLFRIVPPIVAADEAAQTKWNEAYDIATSSINQVDSVKQAASEEYEAGQIKKVFIDIALPPWEKMMLIWNNVTFLQRTVIFITQVTVFVFSIQLIQNGTITVGELMAINGYSLMFFGPFAALGRSWQLIQNGITAAAKVEELFTQTAEIYEPKNAVKKEIEGTISFENVTFNYEDGNTVLHDLSIQIAKGQNIALVGESGSGKSTFISLISGYYFPQKGSVLIDGVETNKYDLLSLRKQIGIVPQEIALFNTSLEENIKYGSFAASHEDVVRVSKAAHLDEFIEHLKEGYETLVGERGVKLSVGQKQRLAIARAMLRDPKILILDEPTSALDAMTEKFVTESLEDLMKGRTTFVIAHRLSTVRKADTILVFDKGRIVESGTHSELLKKKNGFYKRLHDYQIGIH